MAAVMLAPPDNTKNLDLVFEHFRRVAEAVSVPVVVQDEPVNTGVTMPAPFLVRLLDEIEGCRYLKLEETPTLPKITAVRQKVSAPVGICVASAGLPHEDLLPAPTGSYRLRFPLLSARTSGSSPVSARGAGVRLRHLPLTATRRSSACVVPSASSLRPPRASAPRTPAPPPPVDDTLAELDDLITAVSLTASLREDSRA